MCYGAIVSQDEYSYTLHMTGFASTLPVDSADDVVQRLRDVVEEVTGKPVEQAPKAPMGFY